MSKELELYKAFIDGLVERKDSRRPFGSRVMAFPRLRITRRRMIFSQH